MDDLPFDRCRHLVILLDGFGYDVVKRYYDEGGLRIFHAPSRLIAPYPTMTDIASADILGDFACHASQARYFDEIHNHSSGSAMSYIAYRNEAYARFFTYRQDKMWDGLAYFKSGPVFRRELKKLKKQFDKRQTKELIAHFASSATVSTQKGETGQISALKSIEQLVYQIIWETHGLVKITLLADHGHTNTRPEQLDVEQYLKTKGWQSTKSLKEPHDFYIERLGLVTVASLWTRNPVALAEDLAKCPGVDLASYAKDDAVVVLSPDGGQATIRKHENSYSYDALIGDLLLLKPILEGLSENQGYYDDVLLLTATATHQYPDALHRLWWAHFGQVENPPSVLISLKDQYCVGSRFFSKVTNMASTHGSLNYKNSVTFIMSTAWPLPPVLRSRDVPQCLGSHAGGRWPMEK